MSFGQRGGYGRGGSGRSFGYFKKPVEVGKEYNVTISDISRKGDGIAKVDGFVVFVPGTTRGQTVRIRVTQVSERYAIAQTVEVSTTAKTTTSESTENAVQQ